MKHSPRISRPNEQKEKRRSNVRIAAILAMIVAVAGLTAVVFSQDKNSVRRKTSKIFKFYLKW